MTTHRLPFAALAALLWFSPAPTAQETDSNAVVAAHPKECDRLVRATVAAVTRDLPEGDRARLPKSVQQLARMCVASAFGYAFSAGELQELLSKQGEAGGGLEAYLARQATPLSKKTHVAVEDCLKYFSRVNELWEVVAKNQALGRQFYERLQVYETALANNVSEWRDYANAKEAHERSVRAYEEAAARLRDRRFDSVSVPGNWYEGAQICEVYAGDSFRILSASGTVNISGGSRGYDRDANTDVVANHRLKGGGVFLYVGYGGWVQPSATARDWYSIDQYGKLRAACVDKEWFPPDNRHHRDNVGVYYVSVEVACPHESMGFHQGLYRPAPFTRAAPQKPARPRAPRLHDTKALRRVLASPPEIVRRIMNVLPPGVAVQTLARGFAHMEDLTAYLNVPEDPDLRALDEAAPLSTALGRTQAKLNAMSVMMDRLDAKSIRRSFDAPE